jgi:hypothetical protein
MQSSQTIPDILKEVTPDYSIKSSTSSESNIYFYIKIFLGLIILTILGFNILQYLSDGTDLLSKFLISIGMGGKKIVGTSLHTLAPPIKKKKIKKITNEEIYNQEEENDELQKAIDKKTESNKINDVLPQSNNNSIIKPTNKKGYCYVGTDRTYRSCVKVEDSDKCMSGQIFPTKDLCINPNIRSI